MIEVLIARFVKALNNKISLDKIHEEAIAQKYSEDDIFLAYKAAELLHKSIIEKEIEINNRPNTFCRLK